MVVVLVLVLAAVLGVVAVVATGRGGALGEQEPDRPPVRLPAGRQVEPRDLDRLRFPLAFRGYRMRDVDEVLDRLAGEMSERDRRIHALEGELARAAPTRGHRERTPSTDWGERDEGGE
ncbi:MAG: DivIVA domain-containing protein [Streptosporangiales bacterium]